MNMQTKKWLLGACGGALVVGAASVANAALLPGLTIDLRITAIDGQPLSAFANVATAKGIDLTGYQNQVGNPLAMPRLTVKIYADVVGTLATRTDEAFQSVQGSLASFKSAGIGAMTGTIVPAGSQFQSDPDTGEPSGPFVIATTPFNSLQQAGDGAEVDLAPQDGSLDRGSEPRLPSSGQGGFVAFRAPSIVGFTTGYTTNITNGREYWIGAFDYQVTETREGHNASTLNYVPRMTTEGTPETSGAFYRTDGVERTADGAFTPVAGDPIVLTTVPEPGSLAVLGLGALGLLARARRRD